MQCNHLQEDIMISKAFIVQIENTLGWKGKILSPKTINVKNVVFNI